MDSSTQKKIETVPKVNLDIITMDYLKQLKTAQFIKVQNQLTNTVDMLMEQEFSIDRELKVQKGSKSKMQEAENIAKQYCSVNSSSSSATGQTIKQQSSAQQRYRAVDQENISFNDQINKKNKQFNNDSSSEVQKRFKPIESSFTGEKQLRSIDNEYQSNRRSSAVNEQMYFSNRYDSVNSNLQDQSEQYYSVNQSRRVSIVRVNDYLEESSEHEDELKQNKQEQEDRLDRIINSINAEKERMEKYLENEKREKQSYEYNKELCSYQTNQRIDYQEQCSIKEKQIQILSGEVNQLKQENYNLRNSIVSLRRDKTINEPDKNTTFSYIMQHCEIISSIENSLVFKWTFENQVKSFILLMFLSLIFELKKYKQIDLCKLLQNTVSLQSEKEKSKEVQQIESFYQSIINMENLEQLIENSQQKKEIPPQHIVENSFEKKIQEEKEEQNNSNNKSKYQTDSQNVLLEESREINDYSLSMQLSELKSQIENLQAELEDKDHQIDQLKQQITDQAQSFISEKSKYQNDLKYIKRQQRELEISQNLLQLEREKFEQEKQEKKQLDELERMQNELSLLTQF